MSFNWSSDSSSKALRFPRAFSFAAIHIGMVIIRRSAGWVARSAWRKGARIAFVVIVVSIEVVSMRQCDHSRQSALSDYLAIIRFQPSC
jgi:hypothetical protein